MRKSRAETAATRQRIVHCAEEAVRRNGIEGVSLHGLMHDAGLTHGGFYRHFRSKEQLLAEACNQGFERMVESVRAAADGSTGSCRDKGLAGLAAIAEAFLAIDHRDQDAAGCPLTTSGSELARADAETRRGATASIGRVVGLIAGQFACLPSDEARARANVALSIMVGAVTLARIADDPAMADRILTDAKTAVLAMAPAAG